MQKLKGRQCNVMNMMMPESDTNEQKSRQNPDAGDAKMSGRLTYIIGLTANTIKFVYDTRTQFKRCDILNMEKVGNSTAWLKINDDIFMRNELLANFLN